MSEEQQMDKTEINASNPQLGFKYFLVSTKGFWESANILQNDVKTPHVVAFYDYHYHRNSIYEGERIINQVSKRFQQLRFFVSDISEIKKGPVKFKRHIPPPIYAIVGDKKYKFCGSYNLVELHAFCRDLVRSTGFKSETFPEIKKDQPDGAVKKAVALNFDKLVVENQKDVVLFLYKSSCMASKMGLTHLKRLAKILHDNNESDNFDVVRINMEANTIPIDLDSHYPAPLLALVRRVEKTVIVKAWGQNLSVLSMIKFVAQNSTNLLKGYDRSGDAKSDKQKPQKQLAELNDPNSYYNRFPSYVTKLIEINY